MIAPNGEELFEFRIADEASTLDAVADAAVLMRPESDDKTANAERQLISAIRGASDAGLDKLDKLAAVGGVDGKILKRYRAFAAMKPIKDVLDQFQEDRQSARSQEEAMALMTKVGEKFYGMLKTGTAAPDASSQEGLMFWYFTMQVAVEKKDKEIGLQGINALEKSPQGEQMKPMLDQMRSQLGIE
ncbi:MAG: hypothetical protein DHS20C21_23010 [Gemmatimonadota bacterium]|nr:MAG: hypothetical protein DHS20C21_23010 [Gemmatimonadota bacterium]